MIRWLRRLVRLGVLAFLVTFGAVWVQHERMMANHLVDDYAGPRADAALVLGAGIQADGILSFEGRRRVAAGVRLHRDGKAARVIMSDGSAKDFGIEVSGRMKDYAVELGAPAEAIVEDRMARTTFESMRLVAEIAEAEEIASLILVTDGYHLTRSRQLAAQFDLPVAGIAASDGQNFVNLARRGFNVGRETLAWWYNLAKVVAWHGLGWLGWDDARRAEKIF